MKKFINEQDVMKIARRVLGEAEEVIDEKDVDVTDIDVRILFKTTNDHYVMDITSPENGDVRYMWYKNDKQVDDLVEKEIPVKIEDIGRKLYEFCEQENLLDTH